MGNQAVRKCVDRMGEVSASCPDCTGGAGVMVQRRRVEQMTVEVDEARQENQRLNKQTHKLRAALEEARSKSGAGKRLTRPETGADASLDSMQANRAMHDELLQLKRVLWDMQRENALLKQGSAAGVHGPSKDGERRVSFSQYQQLRRQLDELQRAYDAAASQTERMKRQSRMGSQQQTPSPSHNGSVRLGSLNGSCATSGVATPVDAGSCSLWSSNDPHEGEIRRRVQAVQAENERLRRQIRMLASK